MKGSGLRIRGNPLNGPRGPGAIRPRALDFDGAVAWAALEGPMVGACSEDIAVLQNEPNRIGWLFMCAARNVGVKHKETRKFDLSYRSNFR